ncbi:DUF6776 family protein [Caldimonas caldifontis]|uniref:Uncharacterized protein n=1 Tax=Caldimonas caldifontis TaxID=1452508 RepID=A0A2S5SQT3_9BURK|nr:DUF6776 family protein [Caldimonas caldifontis]PPE65066.1 hypothetical protein C1704_16440 [Caldimonas caldifontis]
MRWKLIKRRLSVSAPRMTVRSHLPWPLRWAALAVMLGFSGAIALWAFEFGKDIAGLDRVERGELSRLRAEVQQLRQERDKAQSIANTAESLLKMERVAQERLAEQIKQLEADNLALQDDLGFFERLMPTTGEGPLALRGLQAEVAAPGQMRYQLLIMQNGRAQPEFRGRYEIRLAGSLDGKAWSQGRADGGRSVVIKHYKRVQGVIDFPPSAVVQQLDVRVIDANGTVRAQQTLRL